MACSEIEQVECLLAVLDCEREIDNIEARQKLVLAEATVTARFNVLAPFPVFHDEDVIVVVLQVVKEDEKLVCCRLNETGAQLSADKH